jgi:glycerol-3-phosphate dehydrogenase (NAD(P)+)
VGTPLDEAIIFHIKENRVHPRLQRPVPDGVHPFTHHQIAKALRGVDFAAVGVSSFGVDWFLESAGPWLEPGMPLIAVTKGLVDLPDGSLQTIPGYVQDRLQERIRWNAIGGPCIAHELAARRQTCVVFCGTDENMLNELKNGFQTSYYHIWTSSDVVGVEVCAALKNAYALGVGLAVGMMEKAGPDGLAHMYNPQAAVFAQSCREMRRFLEILGGGLENIDWLPGPGDLYVTVFGGRTVRLGRLLGGGLPYPDARQQMAGETLESVEIITRIGRALPRLEARGLVLPDDFPLMRLLHRIIHYGEAVNLPWDQFFDKP